MKNQNELNKIITEKREMSKRIRCPDCDIVSGDESIPGNRECSYCHGTGYISDVVALIMSMEENERECEVRGGSGVCQKCFGKGYIES